MLAASAYVTQLPEARRTQVEAGSAQDIRGWI
jgi:hypothetical protein